MGQTNGTDKLLITNIQRFSLHDGPGIRTTVFLKGCSLCCQWCSNPENIAPYRETYHRNRTEGVYGAYITVDALVKDCLRDRAFYTGDYEQPSQWLIHQYEEIRKLPGGVTFSGGEALLQIKKLIPAIVSLHNEGIHIAVETSLFIPMEALDLAMEHIDLFYVDVKTLNREKCKVYQNGDLSEYLRNIDRLLAPVAGKRRKPVIIRVPVIGGKTDDAENRQAVKTLLEAYRDAILKIELIKEHNLGESKYRSLGREYVFHGVEDGLMVQYCHELEDLGIAIEICTI